MADALAKRGRVWGAVNRGTLEQLRAEVRSPIVARWRWWKDRMLGRQAIGAGAFITRHPGLDGIEARV
jgi:hypothetical protein